MMHSQNCQVIRRKLVRYGWFEHPDSLSMHYSPPPREEWVVEECGTPLFTGRELLNKTCAACAEGYTHPENAPFNVREFDREFLKSVGVEQD